MEEKNRKYLVFGIILLSVVIIGLSGTYAYFVASSELDGIWEEFEDLLHQYQFITRMADRRIHKICTLFFRRIQNLKRIVNHIN